LYTTAALAVLLAACGVPAPPVTAPDTAQAVASAEDAEGQRRYDEARALYEDAVRTAPDAPSRAWAARAFARSLIAWGEYEAAERNLEIAVASRPEDVPAWHDLGMLRHLRGDVPGAEAAFRRSIHLAPGDPRSRIALAALLWQAGRHAAALDEYRALARLDLPDRLADKVRWAIRTLETHLAGDGVN
jgi:tetratricopeptide (TPR) repeat protein